ncbi:hypothetical protein MVEN_01143000 [Mycena venus]|uniref:Uncharacterized protein n=1 Tax=Mycena venus TaxID=2733690 RepID=A0A8H7CVA8_9AGAR|nr:hypothetical protein MVEN_01143000 [Mycena venus]
MMASLFGLFTVLATASAASVSWRDEASCSAAINNTVFSPDPAMFCLRTGVLRQIVTTATTHENVAPVARLDEINGWLGFMCETGFCSPQTLESIASTVEAGCGSDLSGLPGITLSQGLSVVAALKQNYPVVRDFLCLRNTARSNQFCMTELLADNRTQDLYNADPEAMVGKLVDLALNNLDCNECTKAAYSIAKTIQPNLGTGNIDVACGANFTATQNTPAVGINHTALAVEFKPNGVMGLVVPSLYLFLTMLFFLAILN